MNFRTSPVYCKYRTGLNHTWDNGRAGHCQTNWHSACCRALVFVLGQKLVLTINCLYLNKVSSSACGRATGVMITAPIFRRGTVRVEDERTILYLRHRPLAEVNGSVFIQR